VNKQQSALGFLISPALPAKQILILLGKYNSQLPELNADC
jgi:hypothetical protein